MTKSLEPVAKPLVIDETKKPFVILMVGVNGAGKTTLLKVLLGTVAYSGSASHNGEQVFKNHNRNVAFVPQQPHIPTGITVAEYVSLGRAKRDGWGHESSKSRKIIAQILSEMNLFGTSTADEQFADLHKDPIKWFDEAAKWEKLWKELFLPVR